MAVIWNPPLGPAGGLDFPTNAPDTGISNAASDSFNGLGGNDTLFGNAGNDTLNGGSGIDIMRGGLGNDTYVVDSVFDQVIELAGQGIDTVRSSVSRTLGANQENLVLTGGNAINGFGNNLNNVITGNNANNILRGFGGNDTIRGLGGNDTLDGGLGNDLLIGGAGNDNLVGGAGNDRLNGTNFTLEGNGERDSLRSGSLLDRDIFILGERSGGIGRVYYNNLGNADYAVIRDFDRFDVSSDRIQLLGNAANYTLANVNLDGIVGAGIRFGGDLIGIVQGVNAANLNLGNANQFTYV